MNAADDQPEVELKSASSGLRGRLFRKYVALFLVVVGLALIPGGVLDIWFSYRGIKTLLVRVQTEQARAAAAKIAQFVSDESLSCKPFSRQSVNVQPSNATPVPTASVKST